jgi:alkylation response protein AidB-like acyl-CoA dehydrogenase
VAGVGWVPLTADGGLVAQAADRATLATAAQLIGLARHMLDLTVAYVTTRRQFGVPVGSFQAVKHRLADALLRLEFAEPAVLAAAWTLTTTPPDSTAAVGLDRDVPAAAILATEAARDVAGAAIQCHGAIGYTVEYELHRYAKRTWALASTVDIDVHLTRLAAALGVAGRDLGDELSPGQQVVTKIRDESGGGGR